MVNEGKKNPNFLPAETYLDARPRPIVCDRMANKQFSLQNPTGNGSVNLPSAVGLVLFCHGQNTTEDYTVNLPSSIGPVIFSLLRAEHYRGWCGAPYRLW